MKKLYSALLPHVGKEKLFVLDFPKNKDERAVKFYAEELKRLSSWCHCEAIAEAIPITQLHKGDCHAPSGLAMTSLKIGIIGSNVADAPFEKVFPRFGAEKVFLNHCLDKCRMDEAFLARLSAEKLSFEEIARYYVERSCCPRMNDETYKKAMVERIKEESLKGVIVNTLKFCDFYPFDQMYIRKELGESFPVLNVEHDLMSKDEGQIMTRLEAFLESIKKKGMGSRGQGQKKNGRYFVGIDSGSHATKLVMVDKDCKVLADEILSTGTSVKEAAGKGFESILKKAGVSKDDVSLIIATGYGRNSIDFANESVTEITCHALGAHSILKGGGTLIDIGGQDSKAIKINKDGGVIKFVMNDKCAAGTGRFLEVIADRLEMDLEEFARLAIKAKEGVSVSSMCSVFAESEVISLIAAGNTREEISKGIHESIASRTSSLIKRVDGEPPYYMSGGVAKNMAMVKELSESLGENVKVIENPQTVGALGAAIHGVRLDFLTLDLKSRSQA